jgi:hypothetical protein
VILGVLITLFGISLQNHQLSATSEVFDSPVSTPVAPTPTIAPISQCRVQAMDFVARTYGIPKEELATGDYFELTVDGKWIGNGKEIWIDLPHLHRRICSTQVSAKGLVSPYHIAIDEQGRVVDRKQLEVLEKKAASADCGKFDPALCARLSTLADNDQVNVAIWLTPIDAGVIYDAVAAHYPASLQPHKGLPYDRSHPDFERAFQEVMQLMRQAYQEKEQPILNFLQAQGYSTQYSSTLAPIVFAKLPKSVIAYLASRDEVVGIYLHGSEILP